MKKYIIIALAAATLAAAGAEIAPDIRYDGREAYIGLTAKWTLGERGARATPAKTRTVYVEEYRIVDYGPLTAQANGTVDDTAGVVVDEREEPAAQGIGGKVGDHFKRNAGRYALSVATAALGYVAYQEYGKDKDSKDAPAPQPTTNAPERSPTVVISAGNQSPVSVTITIQEMAE